MRLLLWLLWLCCVQGDSFANAAFRGNPAACVVLPISVTADADLRAWNSSCPSGPAMPISAAIMQKIAGEVNVSETAFVVPLDNGEFLLRWFTPVQEVCASDCCHHLFCLLSVSLIPLAASLVRLICTVLHARSGCAAMPPLALPTS